MKKLLISLVLLFVAATAFSVPAPRKVQAKREYHTFVKVDSLSRLDEPVVQSLRSSNERSIFATLGLTLLSTIGNQAIATVSGVVGKGISTLAESVKSKRGEWLKKSKSECHFSKSLPMYESISDFYSKPSSYGPMDPTGMIFRGFGCSQSLVSAEDGKIDVFYLSCSLDESPAGLERIVNHGKFQVKVDSICFYPFRCDIPNDSLTTDISTRVGFDFKKRNNLKFNVKATIKSSWMNFASEVFRDVELGDFTISVAIDSTIINKDGAFVYGPSSPEAIRKAVASNGESFIVPRSYVGTPDGISPGEMWGTGQYKVEIQVEESCDMAMDYYASVSENGKTKWNGNWRKEWKQMASRKPDLFWKDVGSTITRQWNGSQVITTVLNTTSTTFISTGGQYFNDFVSSLSPDGAPGGKPSSTGPGGK